VELQWHLGLGVAAVIWVVGVVVEGLAAGGALVVPWLLQGGVALHLGWESTDWSTSMGVAIVGGLAAATAA